MQASKAHVLPFQPNHSCSMRRDFRCHRFETHTSVEILQREPTEGAPNRKELRLPTSPRRDTRREHLPYRRGTRVSNKADVSNSGHRFCCIGCGCVIFPAVNRRTNPAPCPSSRRRERREPRRGLGQIRVREAGTGFRLQQLELSR